MLPVAKIRIMKLTAHSAMVLERIFDNINVHALPFVPANFARVLHVPGRSPAEVN
jgi:hypothetical protein